MRMGKKQQQQKRNRQKIISISLSLSYPIFSSDGKHPLFLSMPLPPPFISIANLGIFVCAHACAGERGGGWFFIFYVYFFFGVVRGV